ncbi:Ref family recombination enhancement nuclease [Variovorax sp. PMC12]|uniref:Ref family recombination enhancement nuclease n=1 Tax=Variovorax sp. PMC12 TaxID=2126319 RepID=UPI000D12B36E|nr:Ref family recombination enhancement nuclease [Variovorax sp. PMC12]AVQ81671.1 hypothetical protein C4F17_12325 [Variovorax sp. PMC12]
MTFARKPYVRKAQPLYAKVECRGTYAAPVTEIPVSAPKTPHRAGGVAEQQHKARLAGLGCMCCQMALNVFTPDIELHHLRAGQGWGKGDWMTLMPLCVEHHRGASGVHGLGTKGFPKHYGFTEQDMLDRALQLLNIAPIGQGDTL